MAKENLSIQIEYEKKRAAQCWKKLHGRCAELHIPAEIDGLPVIAVAENAFAAEREAPPAEIGEEKEASLSFRRSRLPKPRRGRHCEGFSCRIRLRKLGRLPFRAVPHWSRYICREIGGGFQPDVRWLRGAAGNFPAEGGQKHRGLCVYGCERLQELRLPEGREKHRAVCLYNCRRMEKINIPLAAGN